MKKKLLDLAGRVFGRRFDAVELAGLSSVVAGVAMIYRPAAFIVGGGFAVAAVVAREVRQ